MEDKPPIYISRTSGYSDPIDKDTRQYGVVGPFLYAGDIETSRPIPVGHPTNDFTCPMHTFINGETIIAFPAEDVFVHRVMSTDKHHVLFNVP